MARVFGNTTISGVDLSAKYYLRNFYIDNRDASTASKRKELSSGTLSKADADALRRASKKLRNFDYSDSSADGANIFGSVSAYIETYNNALQSSSSSSDTSLTRYSKYLKNLSKEYKDELEDIGITVGTDGSLTANETLLKGAKISDVKKLFSSDSDFVMKSSRYAKKMTEKADSLLYTSITNNGNHINVSI